jgi:AbrB family looped-hinge helix DNA binding protein
MPAEVTKVGPKYQVTIPKEVRERLGLKVGDLVQARVGKGHTIILQRKRLVDFDAELEEDLAAAEADYKEGRVLGPFETAEETVTALKRSSAESETSMETSKNEKAGRRVSRTTKRSTRRAVKPSAHARAVYT